jgi:hypothetical protein
MPVPRIARALDLFLRGPAVGVAIGILVSATTDVPFAPEVGLLLGRWAAGSGRLVDAASRCVAGSPTYDRRQSQRAQGSLSRRGVVVRFWPPVYLPCYQTERIS